MDDDLMFSGWFGACPILFGPVKGREDSVTFKARFGLRYWLMANLWFYDSVAMIILMCNPSAELSLPIHSAKRRG